MGLIGIEERETKSGIHVVRVHYTADPDKRSAEWLKENKRGVPERAWQREYEIDWTIAEGLPVYADFNREVHVSKEPLIVLKNRPILRGYDFGLTPSCVWAQVDSLGRLNVLKELVTWDGRGEMKQQGISQMLEPVLLFSAEMTGRDRFEWFDYADPAGTQKAQTDERTAFEIMRMKQIYPMAGPVTFTKRREAMDDILTRTVQGRPKILINAECTMLIEGFQGAYKFREYGTGAVKYHDKLEVEKNAWSHPMNALEYIVGSVFRPKREGVDEDSKRKRRKIRKDDITGY